MPADRKHHHDPFTAVPLSIGTTVYTSPHDSTGAFKTPPLPAGTCTVRSFTTFDNYHPVDTQVTVTSDEESVLDLSLPYDNAAAIESFTATFDSTTLPVHLNWTTTDTGALCSYALTGTISVGNGNTDRLSHKIEETFYHDTTYSTEKHQNIFTDDVIRFEGDTVQYVLSTLDNSFHKKAPVTSQVIFPKSNIFISPYLSGENSVSSESPLDFRLYFEDDDGTGSSD